MIRWMWAFVDRPLSTFDQSAAFWCAATDSLLSPRRGEHGEFATFLPPTGDPYFKLQGVQEGGGAHIDFDVDDVDASTHAAVEEHGAELVRRDGTELSVLRSPGGQLFCLTSWEGNTQRPPVVATGPGLTTRVDQVCVDISPESFDRETAFWSGFTGWELRNARSKEFSRLLAPAHLPVRVLLQRCDTVSPARAHIDIACSDVEGARAWHESLGARKVGDGRNWTVMSDPSDYVYCLTRRDPVTGTLPDA